MKRWPFTIRLSKEDKRAIWFIFAALVIWRVALVALAWAGTQLLPFLHRFPYTEILLEPYGSPLFWSWANFDGIHYLTIAEHGYAAKYTQAFFPLYPLLMRFLDFFDNLLLTGLTISHLAFFVSLFLFYKLARLDVSGRLAKTAIIFLLLFPTSFFFGSLYNESLFLALTLGSFYAARKAHWGWAGVLGAFASAARFIGVFILPALMILYWEDNRDQFFKLRGKDFARLILRATPLLLIPVGAVFYMRYLQIAFDDPLYFIHAQPLFGAERSVERIILLYQVFYRYAKMLVSVPIREPLFFTVFLEAASGVLFFFLSIYAFFRMRLSYFIFLFAAYITPTLTGTLSSVPRYVLVLFPGFFALAILAERYKVVKYVYPLASGLLLAAATIFFTRGYWIA